MNWLERVRNLILDNLRWSPASDTVKQQIADDFIEAMNKPAEESAPQKAEDHPITSRGEKLSDLRARAHAEWEEPWSNDERSYSRNPLGRKEAKPTQARQMAR